jgi:hypothetical protein
VISFFNFNEADTLPLARRHDSTRSGPLAAKELLVFGRMRKPRIFLLSPASCAGKRAALLFNERAEFAVAQKIRAKAGAPLGEVFSFLSGLYFRGKLAYATTFRHPAAGADGIHIITPTDGLRAPETMVTMEDLERFAAVPIDAAEPRYRIPVDRDARLLRDRIGPDCDVVLLGSVATAKYIEVLELVFGSRLVFPEEFLGLGDMSRGGILLRRAASGEELAYISVSARSKPGARAKKGRVGRDAPLEAEPPS